MNCLSPCHLETDHLRVAQTPVFIHYIMTTTTPLPSNYKPCVSINNSTDKAILLLDYGTQLSLDAIWKELVTEAINANNTGFTDDDWELVTSTYITEPFWGIVVNK